MNRFNNIEQKQDNTKVDIKIPMLSDNSNIITIGNQRIRRKPQAQLNPKEVDLRTDYQKKQDQIYKENLIQQNQKQKDQENALNTLGAFTTFIMPSTHIGPLFRNNGKSYTDNWLSGEGSGNIVGNVAIDMLTPFAAGVVNRGTSLFKRVGTAGRFPYSTATSRFQRSSSMKRPRINKKRHEPSSEQLSDQKRTFLTEMGIQGFEFKRSRGYPDLYRVTKKEFLRPESSDIIVPKDGSSVDTYLNWMDQKFNISTPREAIASPSTMFSEFGDWVAGTYTPATKTARINTAYPSNIKSTFIHELGSHGTDGQVANRVIKDYPFTLRFPGVINFLRTGNGKFKIGPTVWNIYSNIASIKPGLVTTIKNRLANKNFWPTHGTNSTLGSSMWYEARATLNEARARLFMSEYFPGSKGRVEQTVDRMSDQDILDTIYAVNEYGKDYYRAYRLLSPKQQKQWMEKVRHALKYLPSATPFTFPIIQSTNESTYKK